MKFNKSLLHVLASCQSAEDSLQQLITGPQQQALQRRVNVVVFSRYLRSGCLLLGSRLLSVSRLHFTTLLSSDRRAIETSL